MTVNMREKELEDEIRSFEKEREKIAPEANRKLAQDRFGGSIFWVRKLAALGGEQTAIEHWQIKRDGTQRCIVEIVLEAKC